MNNAGIKIALVDDSALMRNSIQEILTAWGYNIVLEAVNGKDLFRQLNASNLPDVCITDINMPEMNGYETTRELREKWPGITVVAFSIAGKREEDRVIAAGAHAFISKLSPIAELQRLLKNLSGKIAEVRSSKLMS